MDIDLNAAKIKRNRVITAVVQVIEWQEQPAEGAAVMALWALPAGSWQMAQAETDGSGTATFELEGRLDRGQYTLIIDDVSLADHI